MRKPLPFTDETRDWLETNQPMVWALAKKYGGQSWDDWFQSAITELPGILTKWSNKFEKPVAECPGRYVARALLNKSTTAFRSSNRRNADMAFGSVEIEMAKELEMQKPTQETESTLMIHRTGQAFLVTSIGGDPISKIELNGFDNIMIQNESTVTTIEVTGGLFKRG